MGKRIIARRRGKGGTYTAPSHRYKGDVKYSHSGNVKGRVAELIHDPGHTAPLARVRFEDGSECLMISNEGMQVGQSIEFGVNAQVSPGNVLPLGQIPEGTKIYNIEAMPGDGGKFVRGGGTSATVISHGEKTVVQLPSGEFKSFHRMCRATIGIVAGGGRKDKPFGRAGMKALSLRSKAKVYPVTSGVAKNPVDHPHGGGGHQHVGKPDSVPRGAPPGKKVGHISPKKTGKR